MLGSSTKPARGAGSGVPAWRAALCCVICSGVAAAQELSGPSAAPATSKPASLVAVGYDGKLRELDAPPAIVALRMLDLSRVDRERAEAVLHERAALMDRLVLENVLFLSEIEGTMLAGTPGEKLSMIVQGLEALKPARDWGRVHERVAAVLPEAAADRYEALVNEYEAAAFEQALRTGEFKQRWQFRMARHWQDITWEIQRAAERTLNDKGDHFTAVLEKLDLTSEQEGRIRTMAEAFYIDTAGRPTKAQEEAFFKRMLRELDNGQKLRLLGMAVRGELDRDRMDPP